MHEMALCESVVALVEDEAARHVVTRVTCITLEIGALCHVAPDALLFCFDAVSRGTVAEGASLRIVRIPGAGWCPDCAKTVPLQERFGACPTCGRQDVQMTAGDELRVRELEVE